MYDGQGRQIVSLMMDRRRAGRMGLHESFWGDTIERWKREGHIACAPGGRFDPVEHFGLDLAFAGRLFDEYPIRDCHELVEETDEWYIERNGAGGAHKYWKHKSGTPEHVDYRMKDRGVWERDYRPRLLSPDPGRIDFDAYAEDLARYRREGRYVYHGCLHLFEHLRQSLGDVGMFLAMMDDPAWIRDFGFVYNEFFKAHYQLLFDRSGPPDAVQLAEDMGYSGGLFVSPKLLDELVFPCYRDTVHFLHARGVKVILHSCGGIERALSLIAEAGFDALNPIEVKAGSDVVDFARRYGDRLTFIGGMDVRILESGDRQAIRREVIRITGGIRAAGAGYLFGSDHSITPNVAYPDYAYALEVFRDHCAY